MNLNKPTLRDIGEKRLIQEYVLPELRKFQKKYLMDDCAVMPVDANTLLLASTDYIPWKPFLLKMGIGTFREVGHYLVSANVSDVAAMGGRARGFLASIALPNRTLSTDFGELIRGIAEACREYNILYMGGDTKQARTPSLGGTILGFARKDRILVRSGAKTGDYVFLSGEIGSTLRNYVLVKRFSKTGKRKVHIKKPLAKTSFGAKLAESNCCTSCIDISDGLIGSLLDLHQSSRCSFIIDFEKLPIAENPTLSFTDDKWTNLVLNVGADLELLFTVHGGVGRAIAERLGGIEIGVVTKSGRSPLSFEGTKGHPLSFRPWQHFRTATSISRILGGLK